MIFERDCPYSLITRQFAEVGLFLSAVWALAPINHRDVIAAPESVPVVFIPSSPDL